MKQVRSSTGVGTMVFLFHTREETVFWQQVTLLQENETEVLNMKKTKKTVRDSQQ